MRGWILMLVILLGIPRLGPARTAAGGPRKSEPSPPTSNSPRSMTENGSYARVLLRRKETRRPGLRQLHLTPFRSSVGRLKALYEKWNGRVARTCMNKLSLEPIPAVGDRVDDEVNQAYAAWPDRLYLVGKDGRIVYAGGQGPFGFSPEELERAIAREVARIEAGKAKKG